MVVGKLDVCFLNHFVSLCAFWWYWRLLSRLSKSRNLCRLPLIGICCFLGCIVSASSIACVSAVRMDVWLGSRKLLRA